MAAVRNTINDLKVKQELLQSQIEEKDAQIRQAQTQNYELEQCKLSLQHQETLLQQKINLTSSQEKAILDKIRKLQTDRVGAKESPESLTAKSNDADEKQDRLRDELKEAQEKANRNDMMYEELKKRLIHIEQNHNRMLERAERKEAEAKRLEEGFNAVNTQVEMLKSKDLEDDGDLAEKVEGLQRKLEEAVRAAEIAERNGAAYAQSIENTKQQIAKQRAENDKLRKEMDKMNEALQGLVP